MFYPFLKVLFIYFPINFLSLVMYPKIISFFYLSDLNILNKPFGFFG